MRILLIIFGIVLAAIGGVIAYRAAFLTPAEFTLITDTGRVREMHDWFSIAGGLALLITGASIAFFALRRPRP